MQSFVTHVDAVEKERKEGEKRGREREIDRYLLAPVATRIQQNLKST